jgi:transcriptional regulator with XRE-family HTH domain
MGALPGFLAIGARIREARLARRLTLDVLARQAGLSKGQLSKIENWRLTPTLPALAAIARCLEIDLGDLVRGAGDQAPSYQLLRARERKQLERDGAEGIRHEPLVARPHEAGVFEVFELTIRPRARRLPVTTDGHQVVYLLEGRLDFAVGDETVAMEAGDILAFDGRIPHVPRNPHPQPARLLAMYLLAAGGRGG